MTKEYGIPNILVCVTKQKTCERLIKLGAKLRDELNGELNVLHIVNKDLGEYSSKLEYLFNISKSYRANMGVVFSPNTLESIKEYVKKQKIDIVILGETRQKQLKSSTMYKLQKTFGDKVEVRVVPILEKENLKNII